MSNSKLVSVTKLSPNHSGLRTHTIDRITPHCVVGQLSAESICNCFTSPSREASCNYGIGTDGRVALVVEEKNRSWCSSSNANDQRAVTIECASGLEEPYTMNSKVYKSLVNLCVDICKRNSKTKLLWFNDKAKALNYNPKSNEMVITVHRWFDNKSCPGNWLYSRLGKLAKTVTKKLQKNKKVKLQGNAGLYKYGFKDPIGNASAKLKTLKKGKTVQVIEDDSTGWVKVKALLTTGWIATSHLGNACTHSNYKTITVAKGTRVRRLNRAETKFETDTKLGASHKFRLICTITKGKYAGCKYAKLISSDKNNGRMYYIY
ncbi:MAG: N-acetylmuramoyl-L-alanine amidase [Ruminococcus bovis]|nr:N-acetylmuramoyl-L-alanine amidase [Ruminococcus bovis]MDY3661766.1 N-acetylmuramoyl-L-alanine amidase [Ruminococcus bovis]